MDVEGEHKFTDNWSLSGLYVYNRTIEEGRGNFAEGLSCLDGSNYLVRHPKVFVLNNTNVLEQHDRVELALWVDQFPRRQVLRGGARRGRAASKMAWRHWGSVRRSSTRLTTQLRNCFRCSTSRISPMSGRASILPRSTGVGPTRSTPRSRNLVGRHSLKFGADLRELFVATTLLSETAGRYSFQDLFSSGPGRVGGYDFASFLLGAPSTGSISYDRGDGKYFTRYWGAYAHDDWRPNAKLTLNYGLRIEHEDGLREENNRITVGFDPDRHESGNAVHRSCCSTQRLYGSGVQGRLALRRREWRERLPRGPPGRQALTALWRNMGDRKTAR